MKIILVVLNLIISASCYAQFGSQDSGGQLIPEEACYDVKFYDLTLTIDPDDQIIGGYVTMSAGATEDFDKIIVDLDTVYIIESISLLSEKVIDLNFEHTKGKILIYFPHIIKQNNLISIKIVYSGKPRISKNPPWDDGFIWQESKDGLPWVNVTCQGGGADIWFP